MGASSLPGVGGWFGWQAGLESSKVYGIATGVSPFATVPEHQVKGGTTIFLCFIIYDLVRVWFYGDYGISSSFNSIWRGHFQNAYYTLYVSQYMFG